MQFSWPFIKIIGIGMILSKVLRWSRPVYYSYLLQKFAAQLKKAKTPAAKAKELHDIVFYLFMTVSDIVDVFGWMASVSKHKLN